MTDEDREHLDKALLDIEKRIELKKIINRSESVRELWQQRLYLGRVIADCAAVFQRYQLDFNADDLTDEDREGVHRINQAFRTMREVALELQ